MKVRFKDTVFYRYFNKNVWVGSVFTALFIVLLIAFAGSGVYVYNTHFGTPAFTDNVKCDESAYLYTDSGALQLIASDDTYAFCAIPDNDLSRYVLITTDDFEILNDKGGRIFYGVATVLTDNMKAAVSDYTGREMNDAEYLVLDTTVKSYSPLLRPLVIGALCDMQLLLIVMLISAVSDAKLYNSLSRIDDLDDTNALLDVELMSMNNVRVDKHVIITDSFFINRRRKLIIPLQKLRTLFIKRRMKKSIPEYAKLYADIDGKRILLIKGKCTDGMGKADFVLRIIQNNRADNTEN